MVATIFAQFCVSVASFREKNPIKPLLDLNPIYWTNLSIMKDMSSHLNRRIASRVRELRAAHGLSLEALANKTGVSRSMISVIERAESSPTAVVLEKLAAGL